MAHFVENMAYVGKVPWHGLGNQLSENQPIEIWRKQAGLDWAIKESPVRYVNAGCGRIGELLSFDKHKVLYRSDNLAPLSVVSDRYNVVQPEQILEFYRDLTEISGFQLETAGVLKGGRKIWALARTGQHGVIGGNDRTNAYVLLATACDGTLATTAQFTAVRVVCNNTLAVALNGKSEAIKVSHRSVFDSDAIKKRLGINISAWDDFMYRLKALSARRVNTSEAEQFVKNLFAPDTHVSTRESSLSSPGPSSSKEPNARAIKRVLSLFEGKGRGSTLSSSQNTAYGLINAVTEFVDHEKRARSTDNRLDSAWFGPGADLKDKALDHAVKLIA